tara:strand:- start:1252 stop:1485 length:234 start_codon:yes stop_codon:yes gene_type:complete
MDERLSIIKQPLSNTEDYMHGIGIFDYETIKDRPEYCQMVYHGREEALDWILQEWNDAFCPDSFCRREYHGLLCRVI